MNREVGLYGNNNLGVLPFLGIDFERRGYTPKFRRDSVFTPDQVERFEIVATFGLRGRAGDVRDAYRRKGVPVLVADSAHLRRDAKRYHKVVWNDQYWIPPVACPPDRLDAFGIELAEDSSGEAILVCGQKPGDSQHPHGSREQCVAWAREVIDALRRVTKREITWRPHPLDVYPMPGVDSYSDPATETLAEALSKSHAVVTYNSTAGLDALIAGVPVVAFGPCVYQDLVEADLAFIDELEVPTVEERRALLSRVAYTQWTVEECRDGDALAFLLPVLAGEDPFAGRESGGAQTDAVAVGEEGRGAVEETGRSAGVFAPPLPPAVVSRLVAAGYGSSESVVRATDEQLRKIRGLGPGRLAGLRKYARAA